MGDERQILQNEEFSTTFTGRETTIGTLGITNEELLNEEGYISADKLDAFAGFEWGTEGPPQIRLREDGFFEDSRGRLLLIRTAKTGELPLEDTTVTDLFNTSQDISAFNRWKRSTLGKGLYTSNTTKAYPLKKSGDMHDYVLAVELNDEDVFDCTNIDFEKEAPATWMRKLAILALESRLLLHPTEAVFSILYQEKKAVKLYAELPYLMLYGGQLMKKMQKEKQIPPRWVLLRDPNNTAITIIGKK